MAGLGYKSFASGEVLTAANLQGYAVDQSVMKFATTADRTTALATPTQGMTSWIDATTSSEQYYAIYNASTNVNGAKTAGWYPLSGQAIFYATASRSAASGTTYSIGASGYSYTELIDNYNWHDGTTNPDRITPTVQGIYRANVTVSFTANASGNRVCSISKSGSAIASNGQAPGLGSQIECTTLVYMNGSTDYLVFQTVQDSGSSLTAAVVATVEFVRPTVL